MNGQRQEQVIWQEQRDSARQLRATLLLGVIAFSITLAIILGNKVDQTAASVIIGVAAGVAASIPTSFILLLLLRHRQRPTLELVSVGAVREPPLGGQRPSPRSLWSHPRATMVLTLNISKGQSIPIRCRS